jgi:hypothetical protein
MKNELAMSYLHCKKSPFLLQKSSDYVMDELINDEEAEQEDDMQYLYECNEPHSRKMISSDEHTLAAITTPSRSASRRHGKSDKVGPTYSPQWSSRKETVYIYPYWIQ